MIRWLIAFAFTQAVEMPIYMRALKGRPGVAFGASAITHPIVWFVIPRAWVHLYLAMIAFRPELIIRSPTARYVSMVLLAESFAVIVEAIYLRAWGLRRALAWSLLVNGASVTLGLLSRALFGWP
ncbi:MAG: hypothetical protein WCJ30_25470 [Deltaproteobacteria bacterium]